MSLWLPCRLHGFAVPNTVTVTVSVVCHTMAYSNCVSISACDALNLVIQQRTLLLAKVHS